jgi:hypothetical protein
MISLPTRTIAAFGLIWDEEDQAQPKMARKFVLKNND